MDTIKHILLIDDCVYLADEEVQEARNDTLFLINSLYIKPSDIVLEIGIGMGVGAVKVGKLAMRYFGIDINTKAVELSKINCILNNVGLSTDLRCGDCYSPVKGLKFDVIFANPPQLPTPDYKDRIDWIGWSNNGGRDGRDIINKIIEGSKNHLNPDGTLYLLHFDMSNIEKTITIMNNYGFDTRVVATKLFQFGKMSFERLDYISSFANDKILCKEGKYFQKASVLAAKLSTSD
jgi:release factor glutamine methyltransferase